MEFARNYRAKRSVNLTSLIDIIFLLVVFFLLTSEFVVSEVVEMNLSTIKGEESADTEKQSKAVLVVLVEGGRFMLAGKEYSLDSLTEVVGKEIEGDKDKSIIVVNKEGVSVQNLVTTIDGIKSVGGYNVSIVEGAS